MEFLRETLQEPEFIVSNASPGFSPWGKPWENPWDHAPPFFLRVFPRGENRGGALPLFFPRGENRGALPPPTFPQGFPPTFPQGFPQGETLGIYPGFSVGFPPCVLTFPPLFLRGESGGGPHFSPGGPPLFPRGKTMGKPCIKGLVNSQKRFLHGFPRGFPQGGGPWEL